MRAQQHAHDDRHFEQREDDESENVQHHPAQKPS